MSTTWREKGNFKHTEMKERDYINISDKGGLDQFDLIFKNRKKTKD